MHESDAKCVLEIGDNAWPFPVPIVKRNGRWFFDTEAGKDELLSRRIGKNELATLPAMRAYVDAQREYASTDHNGDGVIETGFFELLLDLFHVSSFHKRLVWVMTPVPILFSSLMQFGLMGLSFTK